MSGPLRERHAMLFDVGTWEALGMIARLKHTSVSAELRAAADAHIARHGLAVVAEEVVPTIAGWETLIQQIHRGGGSTAEEKIRGGGGGTESVAGDPA